MLNQILAIYLKDTYTLHFKANAQATFEGISEAEIADWESKCKELTNRAWHLFKQVLYEECGLESARADLRASHAEVEEANWVAMEAIMVQHLLRHSDRGSHPASVWESLQKLAKPLATARAGSAAAEESSISLQKFPRYAEALNQALAFSLEWGENFEKPILLRMQRAWPELSINEIETLEKEAQHLKSAAWKAYEDTFQQHINDTEAAQRLRAIFPDISAENLSRLASQGMYYAWRG
jgi:hypothetical protein